MIIKRLNLVKLKRSEFFVYILGYDYSIGLISLRIIAFDKCVITSSSTVKTANVRSELTHRSNLKPCL